MTDQRDRVALRSGLEELLGPDRAATLWSMLQYRDDLATQADLFAVRDELHGEIDLVRAGVKEENALLRSEVKDEIRLVRSEVAEIRTELNSFIRTFIRVQVATVLGVAVMVVGLMQFL